MDLEPIGTVSSPRTEPLDDDWDGVTSAITLDDRFGPEALAGLDEFAPRGEVRQPAWSRELMASYW